MRRRRSTRRGKSSVTMRVLSSKLDQIVRQDTGRFNSRPGPDAPWRGTSRSESYMSISGRGRSAAGAVTEAPLQGHKAASWGNNSVPHLWQSEQPHLKPQRREWVVGSGAQRLAGRFLDYHEAKISRQHQHWRKYSQQEGKLEQWRLPRCQTANERRSWVMLLEKDSRRIVEGARGHLSG